MSEPEHSNELNKLVLPKFQQVQYEFAAHLRDPEINKAPSNIEERRLEIYRGLFYRNIENFLSSGFPILRKIYADDAWHSMVRDFFSKHQSRSPYFLEITQEFLLYLQHVERSAYSHPPFILELAHYEWVELALDVAEDDESDVTGVVANGDLLRGIPAISSLAWHLSYTYPVHKLGPQYIPLAPDSQQPTCLVVYRDAQYQVKFLEINAITYRLIELLKSNDTLSGHDALSSIAQEVQYPNPDVLIQGGMSILEDLRQKGIVLGTRLFERN